jgi:hypothetical protein
VCRVLTTIVDGNEESEQDCHISNIAGVAHGASRVASRGASGRHMEEDKEIEQAGSLVCVRRCRPTWKEAR